MIELRYFGGLSVKRDWTLAKSWLSRELRRGTGTEFAGGDE